MILSANEVQRLLSVLGVRESTLVLLAFGTGLRMSELFGLKWNDIDFQKNEISVTRSIVFQVVGPCKTEASQKPVPLDPRLAEARIGVNRRLGGGVDGAAGSGTKASPEDTLITVPLLAVRMSINEEGMPITPPTFDVYFRC